MKAYIQQSYVDMIGQKPGPTATQHRKWFVMNIKTKSIITLTLSDGRFAQVSTNYDDNDKTEKDLWRYLDNLYLKVKLTHGY